MLGDMQTDHIPKTYTAKDWENRLYTTWEESGFFRPENLTGETHYTNILPPPNANGELHLGHASGYTVMDIFGRFARMRGKKTLLLPGKDHAGIQTQVVFEKKLYAEQGRTRHDLGREAFYQATYNFCLDRAEYMRSQEKRIGLSADWSRETFTLDPAVSHRVQETFVKMYQAGMIYHGERIINWCPRCATALSDVEVVHRETEGKLFFIRYPLQDSTEVLTVATTRPETLLGDTAVAVHPNDERYHAFIGKRVILPLVNRVIPIIADPRIDPAFGTGAVKITPAHDSLDWEIGQTHHLKTLQVIGTDARITELGGVFHGLSINEARMQVLEALTKNDFLIKEEAHLINLASCERCQTSIEPLISKQWFVNVDAPSYSLKQKSIQAIQGNTLAFHPESMRKQMIHWLENLHDWCISRQLWWGHRIPVWYRKSTDTNTEEVYCGTEAPAGDGWAQDEDTLDTWFSSGQWPYTTLGYPDTPASQNFYPTDMMVMGRDLLLFWATRMIMFGVYNTGQVPFRELYFSGLVRDKHGKKMSKSKGNGIDVLRAIDQYGADAVRLSLVLGTTPGLDFNLSDDKIESFRNFINKLWNISRYVGTQTDTTLPTPSSVANTDADRWILHRLDTTIREVTRLLENRQISLSAETLREFTWNDFADWYVEVHKVEKNDACLRFVLDTILRLWHPFIPFVTEAIHQTFHFNDSGLLMMAVWPSASSLSTDNTDEERFEHVKNLIVKIRNARALYHIDPVHYMTLSVLKQLDTSLIYDNAIIFQRLARIQTINTSDSIPENSILIRSNTIPVFLHLADIIDKTKERLRFEHEKQEKERYLIQLETKLNNPHFCDRAKPEVVAEERQKYHDTKQRIADLTEHITFLS
ncbi:MAG: valine--tRNA ligase [Minisyncoccota bacterium]